MNCFAHEFFSKIPEYNSIATDNADATNELLTVSRLVQCVNPPNFHLKIYRNYRNLVEWPMISLNMSRLGKIAKRIESIHVHRSVYDNVQLDRTTEALVFPIVTHLNVTGFALSCDIPN